MSVITQDGDSPLMMAAREGRTEVVSLLLMAGANLDLQNKVKCKRICIRWFDFSGEMWCFYCAIMCPLSINVVLYTVR